MQYVANAQEAKMIDGISINEIGIPSFVLMERAALKVARYIQKNFNKNNRIIAVCGSGNNGADGVAVCRILQEKGYQTQIIFIGKEEKATEEMKLQLSIAKKIGIAIDSNAIFPKDCIIIDAIFGIGLSRNISGIYAEWIKKINQAKATVISVDIPSGIDASTGKILGEAIKANTTITFGVNKLGLILFPGTTYAGTVIVTDIGFPKKAVEKVSPGFISYQKKDLKNIFPSRKIRSNKGSYGKLLVIAGSKNIAGAACFTAGAAYRMGCGLVHVITHENNRQMLQEKLPEALLTIYEDADVKKGENNTKFFEKLNEKLQWASAIAIGPGIGTDDFAKKMLMTVLHQNKPTVLDADALNLFEKMNNGNEIFQEIIQQDNFILTPHLKEMSRLTKQTVKEIQDNMIDTLLINARGCTIVLKDARTIVSNGNKNYINQSGNNALAKGGSGDALCGIIAGLITLNMNPFDAAALGVFLHGLAAEEYVKNRSISSMLASELLEIIPQIMP